MCNEVLTKQKERSAHKSPFMNFKSDDLHVRVLHGRIETGKTKRNIYYTKS